MSDAVPYSEHLRVGLQPHVKSDVTIEMENAGVNGEISAAIRMRAPYNEGYNIVVILAGTNDMARFDADVIYTNLRAMYDAFEQKNAIVVAVTVPNVNMVQCASSVQSRVISLDVLLALGRTS